ncbi:DUF2442 domain-containing protein [Spirosoma montaniterrae]|uniref:DUF2442 domain-containing protein n=1 Tax=Spirosoma montaniterrae TaxID=1178516 RepID=A0A1P9WVD1_9BACT|nr:DUF2442 domain-containing protein [Spirosoma montaniterrae]AQG79347.1 hypothetical protein AWR27_08455 [Spirosoma montaniterrae]
MKYIRVTEARHIGDYKVLIRFNDNTEQTIDFGPFLYEHPHPQYNRYRDLALFKTFTVEMGNLVWGENWDLIFPVEELHRGILKA